MSNIFDSSFSSRLATLQNAVALKAALDEKLQSGNNKQITDLFLKSVGGKLDIVEKTTVSHLERFFHKLGQLIGVKHSLDFESNIQKAAEIIEKLTKEDDRFFEKGLQEDKRLVSDAKSTPEKIKDLRNTLTALAIQLKNIEEHVGVKRTLKWGNKLKTSSVIKVYASGVKPAVAYNKEACQAVYNKLAQNSDVQQFAEFISNYPEKSEVAEILLNHSLSDQEKIEQFKGLLWRAMALNQSADAANALLCKLSPKNNASTERAQDGQDATASPDSPVRTLALVFGDSFLQNSKLEGDLSSEVYTRKMCQFITSRKYHEKNEKLKDLEAVLRNPVGLGEEKTGGQLREEILSVIAASPGKNCLLLGGWQGHAVIYEIQQAKNGTYSLRIYNQGEGIQYHTSCTPYYREKRAPCIAVEGISSTSIFSPLFLQSLQGLKKVGKGCGCDPAELLATHLLPLLDGQPEAMPEHVQQMVSPQNSGTCTYKSLQAFISHSLTVEELKLFLFEFKFYLLEEHARSAVKELSTDGSPNAYKDARQEYQALKRCVERYATSIEKMGADLKAERMEQARALLNQWNVLLKEREMRIIAYEKEKLGWSIEKLHKCPVSSVPAQKATQKKYEPTQQVKFGQPLHDPSVNDTLQVIQALPPFSDKGFTKAFEATLEILEKSVVENFDLTDAERVYLLNEFARKIPSLKDWEKLQPLQFPKESFNRLNRFAHVVHENLTELSKGEQLGLYYSLLKGVDVAFKQTIPSSQHIAQVSLLHGKYLASKNRLQTADPYWTEFLSDLKREDLRADFAFKDMEIKNPQSCLSERVVALIMEWWDGDSNKALREHVDASVKKDRKEQEEVIKGKEARLDAEIKVKRLQVAQDGVKLAKLSQVDSSWTLLNASIQLQTSKIIELTVQRASVRSQYEKSTEYWPKGFEIPEGQSGAMTNSQKATFLLTQARFFCKKGVLTSHQEVIPGALKKFIDQGVFSRNLANKERSKSYSPSVQYTYGNHGDSSWGNFTSVTIETSAATYQRLRDTSIYLGGFSNPEVEEVYQELFLKDNTKDETYLPHDLCQATRFMKHCSLGADELLDLAAVWEKGENTRVESLLSHFDGHSDKLTDVSWINFFHALLFDKDILQKELTAELTTVPQQQILVKRLKDFFERQINNSLACQQPAVAANLAWLGSKIQEHIEYVRDTNPGILSVEVASETIEPVVSPKILSKILKEGSLPAYEKQRSAIYEALLAASENSIKRFQEQSPSTPVDQQFFGELLLLHCLRKQSRVEIGAGLDCSLREADAQSTSLRLVHLLQQYQKKGVQIDPLIYKTGLLPLLQQLYPTAQCSTFQVLPDNKQIVIFNSSKPEQKIMNCHLLSGELEIYNRHETLLYNQVVPYEIKEKLRKEKVFADDVDFGEIGYCSKGSDHYLHSKKMNLFLHINHKNEIWLSGHTLMNGKWCLHVPFTKDRDKSTRAKQDALESHFTLRATENATYLLDRAQQIPRYSVAPEQIHSGNNIFYSLEGSDLSSLCQQQNTNDPKQHDPEQIFFSKFEAPEHTFYLKDSSGKITEIQFPRLGMAFKWTKTQDGWKYVDPEGKFLAQEQYVPDLAQMQGYLVLENDKDSKKERKVIVPIHEGVQIHKGVQAEEDALTYTYTFDFSSNNNKVQCASYAIVNKSGRDEIIPETLTGRYYLARMQLEMGQFDKAEELLFAHEAELSNRRLTGQEQEVLKGIIKKNPSSQMDPRAVRLRMRALYLDVKNEYLFSNNQFPIVDTEEKTGLIKHYLENLGKIEPLDKEDELFILRFCPEVEPYTTRISELEGTDEGDVIQSIHVAVPDKSYFSATGYYLCEPDWFSKLKYWIARQFGVLPFDPVTVTNSQFGVYYNLLSSECYAMNTWPSSKRDMFVQAIYYMTYFSKDSEVRKGSLSILENIPETVQAGRVAKAKVLLNPKQLEKKRGAKKRGETTLANRSKDLYGTQLIQSNTAAEEQLRSLKSSYFVERAVNATSAAENPFENEGTIEITDATIKKKFTAAKEDYTHAASHSAKTDYELNSQQSLEELKNALDSELTEQRKILTGIEKGVVSSVHLALTSNAASDLQFKSKKRALPTIGELCIAVAKPHSDTFIEKQYPELSDTGREELKRIVKVYLVQKQLVQQIGRSVEAIQEVENASASDDNTKKTRLNELVTTLSAARQYDLEDKNAPIYLLIESVSNIKMRKDQIENLGKFIDSHDRGDQTVLQMIMGAGKTSVLQPLLAIIFAKEGQISVIDVPEALYAPVRDGLTRVLGNGFNQYVYSIPYDRERAKRVDYLKMFKKSLEQIKEKGACFLRTPVLKQSILTSLFEAYSDYHEVSMHFKDRSKWSLYASNHGVGYWDYADAMTQKHDLNKERVNLISDILKELEINEVVQFDEADTTFNPMVVFKYPIGASQTVKLERSKAISKLLLDFSQDKAVYEKYSIDFVDAYQKKLNPKYQKQGVAVTEELYEKELKTFLIQKAIAQFQDVPSLQALLKNEGQKKLLEAFLQKSTPENGTELEKIIQDKELRELVGTLSYVINSLLKNSILKECGAQYGVDPEDGRYVAKPYAAAKAPKTTMFGDAYEQVVFSTQLYMYNDIPLDGARKMLLQLQAAAQKETAEGIPFLETEAYLRFQKIVGMNTFPLMQKPPQEEHIILFQQAVSKNPEFLLEFLQSFVAPQIKIFPKSISSTPQALIGSSKLAYGYTGTLNTGILANSMQALPELGTDGKTIAAVQTKIENGVARVSVFSEKSGKLPDQVIQRFAHDSSTTVLIDSGGWLKEENSSQFAKRLLEGVKSTRQEIQGVAFHNDRGELRVLEWTNKANNEAVELALADSKYKTAKGELLTIIAQKYETGTNIRQPSTAKAFQTIRKNMTKRDGLQSVFRMRQILDGQAAHMFLSDEVKVHMASRLFDAIVAKLPQDIKVDQIASAIGNIDLSPCVKSACIKVLGDLKNLTGTSEEALAKLKGAFTAVFEPDSASIWRYMTANEALLEQQQSWVAAKHKMREVFEKPLRGVLRDTSISIQQRTALFNELQELVIEKTSDSPFTTMTAGAELKEAGEAIDVVVMEYMKLFGKLEAVKETNSAAAKMIEKMKALYGKENTTLKDALKSTLEGCVNKDDVAPKLMAAAEAQEIEQQVEQQVEQQAEQQVEIELELQYQAQPQTPTNRSYQPLASGIPFISDAVDVAQIARTIATFQKVEDLSLKRSKKLSFPACLIAKANCFISPNLFDNATAGSLQNLSGGYILAVKEGDKYSYMLVSHQDAATIKGGLPASKFQTGAGAALFYADGSLVAESAPGLFDAIDKSAVLDARIITKITTGKTNFTNEEIEQIRSWNLTEVEAKTVKAFYEGVIASKKTACAAYNKSRIRNVLSGIAKGPVSKK